MKRIKSRESLIAVSLMAAVWFLPCVAGAQGGPPPPMDGGSFIQHFDKDGDGMVSASEFPGDESQFNRMDKDGSGYIEESEASQGPPPGGHGPGASIDDLDQDGDGMVSESEFHGPPEIFDRLDTDGDGLLSETELAAERRPGPPPEHE
ncbi:EF-hand domain-containing protein [uncultured Desulfosarcina sp.]|uniref:EF-hand domain-containing protein n=1 Tax=uncultured Desulfosarcina sp. TaxID=218289 RepID=UPI0029C6469E|nr:EF-hand domain-containing protein [uncultured Desulfosarcina sp.]